MRIKRILSFALCLCIVCLALVGCEDEIGAYRDKYDYEEKKVANMDFELYIITDERTTVNATTTVNAYINTELSDKFDSRIEIKYLTADEYVKEVKDAVDSSAHSDEYLEDVEHNRVTAGKIVLVNSKDLMDYFVNSGKLSNLYDFVYNSEYKADFGKLKTQISEDLMEAAMTGENELFAIPNNHIVGMYEYVVINAKAAKRFNYLDTEDSVIRKITSLEVDDNDDERYKNLLSAYYDKETKDLYHKDSNGNFYLYDENGNKGTTPVTVSEGAEPVVRLEKGYYEDQIKYIEDGYVCNIAKTPECTAEEAFASAFAIIAETDIYYWNDVNNNDIVEKNEKELVADRNDVARRAMQIVNAINSDTTIRNLLQYGVKGINYIPATDVHGNEIVGAHNGDDNSYYMDIRYTGNMFFASFNSSNRVEEMWNQEMMDNGENHNNKVNYYTDIYLKKFNKQ